MPGVDPGYSEGGGANSNVHMAVAAGRVPLKLLSRVLDVCNIFVAFAPLHCCQIFASLCIQGASNLDAL